jgi:hypothetical protein
MPRFMPPYALCLQERATSALALAQAGEIAAQSSAREHWHVGRIEYLYEISFLRVFVEWEVFLEQTFLRYLCGYRSRHGAFAPSTGGQHCASLAQAEALIFGARGFALWHDANRVINRSRTHLRGGPHETIIQTNAPRLQSFSAIRHRIAHGQDDAKSKFDGATMLLSGRRYRGARPGRFLRDWDTASQPRQRWIEVISLELVGLANQIG